MTSWISCNTCNSLNDPWRHMTYSTCHYFILPYHHSKEFIFQFHHNCHWLAVAIVVLVKARDDGAARPKNFRDDDLTRNFVPQQHR
eukprot:scaffold15824_cov56-Cyclotella_meneghiniana.AAC.3